MVYSLELKASVEEVKPLRALDIHCRSQPSLRERLVNTEICRAHSKMAQGDLNV